MGSDGSSGTNKVLNHEDRIKTLEDKIAALTIEGGEIPDDVLLKDDEGNVNLAGVFEAEGVVAGAYAVKNNEEAPTVGEAVILPAPRDEDGDGFDDRTSQPMPVDENQDGFDDATKEKIPDGKTVKILTRAVSANSKIFVTAGRPAKIGVVEVTPGEGFVIEIDEIVSEELKVDWWVVEEK